MNRPSPADGESLPLSGALRVDEACQRFEAAWQAGGRPVIDDFLGKTAGPEREGLLRELIRLEVYYRLLHGEAPLPQEYQDRFPSLARAWLEEVLAAGRPPVQAAQPTEAEGPSPAPPPSIDRPRFTAGQVLADRYRVVAPLGRGGMGEVYRADDLKLSQPVALKFLPADLAGDPDRLARFHNEVRVARQVSHPNVCRVYDVGEADGQPFLSMEYIDGEDLAALLRRIGRVPPDKGVEWARQLCAGLAAAHDKGVLHRDLKPGNVMIDGRGRVRLADFGLAGFAGEFRADDLRAGTRAYRAPEQAAGRAVTVQSDLYSLGLVLYEMFTGRPARRREGEPPAPPSERVTDLDPAVERVILRCLEKDPRDRPPSAVAVAATLAGGDVLAAARAAGVTPSPEMVAAAGGSDGLTPAAAAALFAAVLLGLVLKTLLAASATLAGRVPLDKSPDVLAEKAREALNELRFDGQARGSAYGFLDDPDYLRFVAENDASPGRWDRLADPGPPAIYFWYRQSSSPLAPGRLFTAESGGAGLPAMGMATPADPPPVLAGMAEVRLDARQGRLIRFAAVPPQEASLWPPAPEPDWNELFRLAGLDFGAFTPATEPVWNPPAFADNRLAWTARGVYPGWPDVEVRVEAATLRGRPVFFQVIGPWARPERDAAYRGGPAAPAWVPAWASTVGVLDFVLLLTTAALAAYNVRRARGDRPGARRVALAVLAVSLCSWLLMASHVAAVEELDVLLVGLAYALLASAATWTLYLALEPYVRRFWPQTLISWSRLVAGRFRDPRVGRDLLVGALCGVAAYLLEELSVLAPAWVGRPPAAPLYGWIYAIVDVRRCAGDLLFMLLWGFLLALIQVLAFALVLRVVLRKQWLAAAALAAFGAAVFGLWADVFGAAYGAALYGLAVGLLIRRGFLAVVALSVVLHVLFFPLTADLSSWYAGTGLIATAAVAALAGYGVYASLAGVPSRSALLAQVH
jgi:serine/threonine-protein kinase